MSSQSRNKPLNNKFGKYLLGQPNRVSKYLYDMRLNHMDIRMSQINSTWVIKFYLLTNSVCYCCTIYNVHINANDMRHSHEIDAWCVKCVTWTFIRRQLKSKQGDYHLLEWIFEITKRTAYSHAYWVNANGKQYPKIFDECAKDVKCRNAFVCILYNTQRFNYQR